MKDELQLLPGVGPSIANDLRSLGVRSVRDLGRRDPERLYRLLCVQTDERQDPCVLYTFRCAVYAARTKGPDPALLKWWAWKDKKLSPGRRATSRPLSRPRAGSGG
ncbi:MAG: pathogenicity locus [Acidobacteria bacterium]|nr:pathogenicity locus [Acidobacteriota bacterium]